MVMRNAVPTVQIVGYKKTGKTTLVCRLTEQLADRGLRIGTVKHDGHDFEPDVPGTDSWKHRRSGAAVTAVVSDRRTAWFEERTSELDALLVRMSDRADLVLVEGWKREKYPKLALIQTEEQLSLLDEVSCVVGAASWDVSLRNRVERDCRLPTFDWDDPKRIADFLMEYTKL